MRIHLAAALLVSGLQVPGMAGSPAGVPAVPEVVIDPRADATRKTATPGFYSFWLRVVDRVRNQAEGKLETSAGWFSQLRTCKIARQADGGERMVTVWELEVWPRYRHLEPVLDPYFKRKVIFERIGPGPKATFEADEDGHYAGNDAEGFQAEFDWWAKNL